MFRIPTTLVLFSLVACQPADSNKSHPTENGAAAPTNHQNPMESSGYGTIEFRTLVPEGDPEANAFQFEGKTVYLGPAHSFEARGHVSRDDQGQPALGFEIIEAQKEAFSDLTETIVGQKLAVLVDGKVLTMPTLNSRLAGRGIIEGGGDGFTEEELLKLLAGFNG